MGCVIGLIIGCAHDRVIMSDLLIELSCMQDWPEHYFGAVYDCEENLKSILSICKHHMPRWETNGCFFTLNQTI